jgi:DNA-binding NarL/FixJ family response regulator
MYNILVADDHSITLLGTETFLRTLNHSIVGSYGNGVSCLNGIITMEPDIAIIDVSMPGMSGLEILKEVKIKRLRTKVILLTMHHEMSVYLKAKENKFDGYILKDNAQNEIAECIKTVMLGETYLSPDFEKNMVINEQPNKHEFLNLLTKTEVKVAELVVLEKTNSYIAKYLFISEKTVETHKQNIVNKLNLPKGKNVLFLWLLKNMGS